MNILIILSISASLSYYFISDIITKNKENFVAVEKSKEIQLAKEKLNLQARYSQNGLVSQGDLNKSIKLSTLVENNVDMQDKDLLDKLQNAMKIAIIENNLDEPNCSQLSSTNLITLVECESIIDKTNNFAEVKKGEIKVENEKLQKVLSNTQYFSKETTDEDGKTTYQSFDNSSMKANFNKVVIDTQNMKKLKKIVDETDDLDVLKDLAIKINKEASQGDVGISQLNSLILIDEKMNNLTNNISSQKIVIEDYYKEETSEVPTQEDLSQKKEVIENQFTNLLNKINNKGI